MHADLKESDWWNMTARRPNLEHRNSDFMLQHRSLALVILVLTLTGCFNETNEASRRPAVRATETPTALDKTESHQQMLEVLNKKKGQMLKEQMAGKDLQSTASTFDVPVDTASNISFSTSFIPNVGNEPKVIATAFALAPNGVSAPIVGNSGVYMLQLISKNEAGTATNIPQLRRTMASNIRSQVSFRLMETLKENASISDRRSRFY